MASSVTSKYSVENSAVGLFSSALTPLQEFLQLQEFSSFAQNVARVPHGLIVQPKRKMEQFCFIYLDCLGFMKYSRMFGLFPIVCDYHVIPPKEKWNNLIYFFRLLGFQEIFRMFGLFLIVCDYHVIPLPHPKEKENNFFTFRLFEFHEIFKDVWIVSDHMRLPCDTTTPPKRINETICFISLTFFMKWIQLLMISWSVFRLCPCTLIMVYPITHIGP